MESNVELIHIHFTADRANASHVYNKDRHWTELVINDHDEPYEDFREGDTIDLVTSVNVSQCQRRPPMRHT